MAEHLSGSNRNGMKALYIKGKYLKMEKKRYVSYIMSYISEIYIYILYIAEV